MKAYIILLVLLMAVSVAGAQDISYPSGMNSSGVVPAVGHESVKDLIAGEQSKYVFVDQDTLLGASTTSTTNWLQIGISDQAKNQWANKTVQWFSPTVFTLHVTHAHYWTGTGQADADSLGCNSIKFQVARDTTVIEENPDSSNTFVADGYYSHSQYGTWRFLPEVPDSLPSVPNRNYPLRVLSGDWIRGIFTAHSDVADSFIVKWELECARP